MIVCFSFNRILNMRTLSNSRIKLFFLGVILCFCSLGYTHESDEYVGYYHLDKHLPQPGYAIYFSFGEDPLPLAEHIGVLKGNIIVFDIYDPITGCMKSSTKRDRSLVNNRWRYVAPAYHNFESPPFHEILVYHSAERNPPSDGQECYFVSLRGQPVIFAWEAIAHEYYGVYSSGGFYKMDLAPIHHYNNQISLGYRRWYPANYFWENLPWQDGDKAPGLIYWREVN